MNSALVAPSNPKYSVRWVELQHIASTLGPPRNKNQPRMKPTYLGRPKPINQNAILLQNYGQHRIKDHFGLNQERP